MALSKQSILDNATTNHAKLSIVLLNVCTPLYKDLLRKYVPEHTFYTVFTCKEDLPHKYRNIFFPQPASGLCKYDNFDISTIYTLLRNSKKLKEHMNGWGQMPDPNDNCISANVERLRIYRNDKYGHLSKASVDDKIFSVLWKDIRTVVREIENDISPGVSVKYTEECDQLETCPIDPLLYERCLNQLWELENVADAACRIEDGLENTQKEVSDIRRDLKSMKDGLGKTQKEVSDIRRDVKSMKGHNERDMKKILKKLKDQEQLLQEFGKTQQEILQKVEEARREDQKYFIEIDGRIVQLSDIPERILLPKPATRKDDIVDLTHLPSTYGDTCVPPFTDTGTKKHGLLMLGNGEDQSTGYSVQKPEQDGMTHAIRSQLNDKPEQNNKATMKDDIVDLTHLPSTYGDTCVPLFTDESVRFSNFPMPIQKGEPNIYDRRVCSQQLSSPVSDNADFEMDMRAPFIPMTKKEDFTLRPPTKAALISPYNDLNPGLLGKTESVFIPKNEVFPELPKENRMSSCGILDESTAVAGIAQPPDTFSVQVKQPIDMNSLEKGPPTKKKFTQRYKATMKDDIVDLTHLPSTYGDTCVPLFTDESVRFSNFPMPIQKGEPNIYDRRVCSQQLSSPVSDNADFEMDMRAPFIPMTKKEDFTLRPPTKAALISPYNDLNPGLLGKTESVFIPKNEVFPELPKENRMSSCGILDESTAVAGIAQPPDTFSVQVKQPIDMNSLEKGPPTKKKFTQRYKAKPFSSDRSINLGGKKIQTIQCTKYTQEKSAEIFLQNPDPETPESLFPGSD